MRNNRNKIFVIAEAGVNHNGSLKIAKKLIVQAAKAGADAIKFQTFIAENLASKNAPKANYQKKNTRSKVNQFQMLKRLEFTKEMHLQCINFCKKKKIIFLSSAFDLISLKLLSTLKMPFFKIPSGEITNLPYLEYLGKLKKKIILSTGMSTINEIKSAVAILVKNGTLKKNITILHCNTQYPTPFRDANINAMVDIKKNLKTEVGYSDHTISIEASLAAVALGAKVVEKHFTLNRNLTGPDHKSSLIPKEFKELVTKIRNVEIALGHGKKKISPSEKNNLKIVRKSIFVSKNIMIGEKFSYLNLTTKRPAIGICPMQIKKIIGKKAKRCHTKGDILKI